jgi:signal transduction histidine kinase
MLLRKVNDELEARIKERTAELQRANEQLGQKIFERKKAEEALQNARDELEVRVRERTAELVRTNEELQNEITERKQTQSELSESEAQIRALNEKILNMLVVVAHDIRSPLVSMAATLKLLLRGLYGKMDESVKNTMNDLHSRVNKLLGNTEDCLGKTSVVVGGIDFDRKVLDLREDIIDPVLEELSSEIAEKEMVIDNRLGAIPAHRVPINADRVWLKVVFRNLFSNAIKYGGQGGTVAFGFEDHGSCYKLNVFNSGEPIPEDFRDKLFSKFSRIASDGEVVAKGMGLGLYLVKDIVLKHGGDIWYEAKENGSNFVFTLPCD